MSTLDAALVAEVLGLEPLGFEGGFYRETYRSAHRLEVAALPEGYPGARSAATAILYMLGPDSRSLMHRLRTDEVYHFYLGDPVELLLIHPDGSDELVRLGPNILSGERVQAVVPAGTWQGSSLAPGGRFALMGTTMSPGFDLADFELGRRADLLLAHPHLAHLAHLADRLTALTPEVLETDRLELTAASRDLVHAELRGVPALLAGLGAASAPGWPPPFVDERTARYTLARLEEGPEHRGWWAYYVVRREDRALVGVVGFKGPPDSRGRVDIGYSLTGAAEGQGLATEAASALVTQAFADPRVAVIGAEARPEGRASIRVLEKLGFSEAGRLSQGVLRYERRRGA